MCKKIIAFLLLVVALDGQAQQLINPGFELWANRLPVGWGSMDELVTDLTGMNPGLDTMTTDKHSGNYAIVLSNNFVPSLGGVLPGLISTGPVVLDTSGNLIVYGQPYNLKPASYDFYFKYFPQGNDTAATLALLTKWNSALNKRDTLAATNGFIYIPPSTNYFHATVPLYWYTSTIAPDSITIVFSSSIFIGTAPVGSRLLIDDVHLNVNVGVEELNHEISQSNAFPNPATDFISISTSNAKAKYIKIYDLTGRLMSDVFLQNRSVLVDLAGFANGLYVYAFTDEYNVVIGTYKFVVSK